MVQIAILAVLVLIAFILAPWLIAVVVAAAVTYGAALVVAGLIACAAIPVILVWVLYKDSRRRKGAQAAPLEGPRKACPGCQSEIPAGAAMCQACKTH